MSQLSDTHITELRSLDDVPNAPDRNKPIGFILRLAKALHTYGLPAYELEQTMNGCAVAMGYGIQCMSLPTSISMTILPPDADSRTYLIRVSPGEVNLERLRKTTEVARRVIQGDIYSAEGADCLKEIAEASPDYSNWIIIFAFGLVSACIARIFSGGVNEMAVSAIIGFIVGMMAIASQSRPLLDHLLPAVCAFIATLLTLSMNRLVGIEVTTSVVVISGLIILLPGLSLTIALAELATQNLVSGTARLTGTATVFIQLAFGSALAVESAKRLGLEINQRVLAPVESWTIWLAAAVAAVALVPLFAARRKDVGWFLLASLSAFTAVHFATVAMGPSLGAFVGAITVGLIAKIVTRFYDIPGAMIIMPGFIILVPGTVGYRSILALVEKDIITGLATAFDVVVIGISLVAGFLLSSLVHLPKDGAKDHY
ncbi:MAG: threonine/serine exporter family protein [Gammaproteobacteria bacterium]|nr:threonine/serine exporter family protein [Gammaproteobacteria bacterium]